jgi:transcriptional regulator with XRE-family HTH domain
MMSGVMNEYTLGEFILKEMRERDMSAREFSRFVGVSHQTVSKFLDYGEKDVGYPSVDFLLKLARATETEIGSIMRMVEPDLDEVDPQVMVIAEEIARLTPQERNLVEAFVRSIPKSRTEKR